MKEQLGKRTENPVKKAVRKFAGPIMAATMVASGVGLAGCQGVNAEKVEISGTLPPRAAAAAPTENAEHAYQRGIAAEKARQAEIDAAVKKALDAYKASEPAKPTPRPDHKFAPKPENAQYENFAVRFNGYNYDLIDIRTNQRVNIQENMVAPIMQVETGVGYTKAIGYNLERGQGALIQGYRVNGEGDGVFMTRINQGQYSENYCETISDGSVTIVPIRNLAAHKAFALNTAIANNWAHSIVR